MDIPEFSLNIGGLKKAKEPDPLVEYDMLILGGGPASMSAAVYAARKMVKVAIITKDMGGQMLETSDVENWLGIKNINAKDLISNFEDHVKSFDLPIAINKEITKIVKEENVFKVTTSDGKNYRGKTAIITTGTRHRLLEVPGEKEFIGRGVAYCATCDAPFYKNKKAVVAGGGNSAFTTAIDLTKVDCEITLVTRSEWRADLFMIERLKKSEKVTMLSNHLITSINGKQRVSGVTVEDKSSGEKSDIPADGIFIEIGFKPNSEIVKNLVETNKYGEIIVDKGCATSLEGLYAAGDVTNVPYKQIVISAGDGSKAALSAYDYMISKSLI